MNRATNRVMRQDKRENNSIIICAMALFLIGVVFIFSSSSAGLIMKGSTKVTSFLNKQLLFGALGLTAAFIVYKINLKWILDNSTNILFATIGILIVVLILAEPIKGARSWLKIGPFSLQPAEFAKLTLILMTAKVLKDEDVNSPETFKRLGLVTLPILALVVLQKDLGTVMIMSAIILAMMYLAGVDKKILGAITALGVVGVLILSILSPYRIKRMLIFLDPFSDYYGLGYQIIQSLYSIATGGLFGQGLGNSVHKYGFLPENHTDFIFSVITEEVGFIGASIVIFLFVLLIAQMLRVAFRLKNKQLSLITSGIASYIAIESLLNLSVVVSLMPVTGVTLPFISYGGSSLMSKAICIGLVLNINKSSKKTEAHTIDSEREEQTKRRQAQHNKHINSFKNFKKNTSKNTRKFISNFTNSIMSGFNIVIKAVKESGKIFTSIIKNSGTSIKKNKTKTVKTTKTYKSSFSKSKKKAFSKSKGTSFSSAKSRRSKNKMESINLDQVYYDKLGFGDHQEYMNEIDLASVDIEKFND